MAKGDLNASAQSVQAGDNAAGKSNEVVTGTDNTASTSSRLYADTVVPVTSVAPVFQSFRPLSLSGYSDASALAAAKSSDSALLGAPGSRAEVSPVLDKNRRVTDLIQAGVMRRIESTRPPLAEPLKEGEVPQVLITYADTAKDQSRTPDFIVRKDGRIEAAGDFDSTARKQVVIQVERQAGSTANPEQAQQKSIDELVQYVHGRMSANSEVARRGLDINDEYGLMSDSLTKKIAAGQLKAADSAVNANADRSGYSPESQRMMSDMNRFTPGSSGSMSPREVGDYFPRRDVGQQRDETNKVAHAKNAVAGMFNPDKTAPYETVRVLPPPMGLAIGRYGLTHRNFSTWFSLEGEDEYNEGNIAGIMAKLAKKGKVSKEFAAKFQDKNFAAKFVGAMKRMEEGKSLTGEEMRTLFPKELQERVATDTVDKMLKDAGGDVGKTALALHLGKEPGQLTGEDLNNKANKDYMSGAVKLAQLSEMRRELGQGDRVDWQVSPEGNMMKAKIVKAGLDVARNMGTEGRCAEGVQVALSKVGMNEFMGSGDGWAMRHAFLKSDEWRVTNDPTRATAFVRSWAPSVRAEYGGRNLGHVGLLHMENGRLIESSDHKTEHLVNNSRYNQTIYFEYVGKKPRTMEA